MRSWSTLRSRFNHDWLKNQYLLSLSNWIDLLEHDESERSDVEFERSFLTMTLPQWQRRRVQAVQIARDATEELSPQRLFECSPLDRCPREIAGPLADLTHRLWLTRSRVREAVAKVNAAIGDVDTAYEELMQKLNECVGAQTRAALRPLRVYFVSLRDACRRLADALGHLPQVNELG